MVYTGSEQYALGSGKVSGCHIRGWRKRYDEPGSTDQRDNTRSCLVEPIFLLGFRIWEGWKGGRFDLSNRV